jgi:hypothetical protein
MNGGQSGRAGGTEATEILLIFEVIAGVCPRAHRAPAFLMCHGKRQSSQYSKYSERSYSPYIKCIYNFINIIYCKLLSYNFGITFFHGYQKNRWARRACGHTTSKVLSINGFRAFASAPLVSTCPHLYAQYGKIRRNNADIPETVRCITCFRISKTLKIEKKQMNIKNIVWHRS